MTLADRLRTLRKHKGLSQGDLEKRTGLLRCYISRLENGHTVPVIDTLEKMAHALEVPLYQLFYDGEEPPRLPNLPAHGRRRDLMWGGSGKSGRLLVKLRGFLGRMDEKDRKLVLRMAQKMSRKATRTERRG